MKIKYLFAALLLCISFQAGAGVVGKDVSYEADGVKLKGYLVADNAIKGQRPGILVVHEWWGHNKHARDRAEALAKLGYVALAVDMYGDGKQAEHPDDAGKFSSQVVKNLDMGEKRFKAAYKLLQADKRTDDTKIAAIGYCFGGGIVLAMARRGVDLDGVVSFHGSLGAGAPAKAGKVKAKVLVLNGADDPFVKAEQISAFKAEMKNAGVDYEFVNYPGAKHSFTNPDATATGKKFNLPLEYNETVDKKSWKKMQQFFKEIF